MCVSDISRGQERVLDTLELELWYELYVGMRNQTWVFWTNSQCF